MSIFAPVSLTEAREIDGKPFPLTLGAESLGSREQMCNALEQFDGSLHDLMIEHGAVLFRGLPVTCADDFEAFLNATSFRNMPYIGGAAPRSKVTETRVVTANESPPSEVIPFHHEMAQVPSPPGYIFFYCEIAPDNGGATSLLHSAEVCDMFFELAPEFAARVEREGVIYHRTMPGVTDPDSAIGRSWRETFMADTRDEAEPRMSEAGMTWQWLDNDCVRTSTAVLPAVKMDAETGRKVFFNSMVAAYTGWNDARNEGARAVTSASGELLPATVMDQLVTRMAGLAVNFSWQAGDVLCLNNYTVLHARQSFSGERRVLASIAYK